MSKTTRLLRMSLCNLVGLICMVRAVWERPITREDYILAGVAVLLWFAADCYQHGKVFDNPEPARKIGPGKDWPHIDTSPCKSSVPRCYGDD